ncbi:MAG TPA: LytTR family DNA-binding domain-containing protein [Arenimonas sp.]|uniref:LytR/AlgR family response regulator transcription factor n=1 Tax=Arenimonas sp. TaxID=1872635 RepID=UPI002BA5B512|nr:LytTR family DNA-binding domain-containing protein [Arenimonas sp.]HMB58011.1 LytTR family DNA-binding domain-containing protein [Arenimonas sp.]
MKLLIVDDEALARERLAAMIAELPDCEVVGEAANGREAVEKAAALAVDALLLDIAMPVMDGLEAARHLARLEPAPAVIFCTAYDEHALAAFEAAAVDYLVKPVRRERLLEALERARRHRAAQPSARAVMPATRQRSHLSARLRGSLRLIPIEDVHYLQAEEKYVVVHHARGEDLIEESLKSLESEFADRFVRIHRNCLVGVDEFLELRRLPDGQVHAILRHGGAALEVSRRCVPGLRERLKHL